MEKKSKKTYWLFAGLFAFYILLFVIYGFVVTFHFADCRGGLGDAGIFGDMFGAFNAFFTGLAFLALAFTIYLQIQENRNLQDQIDDTKHEKRNSELQKYITCLTTISSELSFYREKLIQLSGEVTDAVNGAHAQPPLINLPTYELYPDFLQTQKIELSKFHFNSDLISLVGKCHFELCHNQARLKTYLHEMRSITNQNAQLVLQNALGFKGLLDVDTRTFEDAIRQLEQEINAIKKKIA